MKTFRTLVALALVVAAAYAGWLIAPPYYANFQLEDAMNSTARFGAVDRRKSEEAMRREVMKEVQAQNIPLTPEQVQVERDGGDVLVWAEYTVHIDLPFYPFDLHFQPMSQSKKKLL